MHREVTQFTRLKGLMYLADDRLHLSCADFVEAYTGRHDWKDYEAAFRIAAHAGAHACVNFRVQGAIRSYAAGFDGEGSLSLFKNDNGYRTLASVPFAWESDRDYEICVAVRGSRIQVSCGEARIEYDDADHPWLQGAVGFSVRQGTHASLASIKVRGL